MMPLVLVGARSVHDFLAGPAQHAAAEHILDEHRKSLGTEVGTPAVMLNIRKQSC